MGNYIILILGKLIFLKISITFRLAEWMKKKYDAYNVTWKDVKYQVRI